MINNEDEYKGSKCEHCHGEGHTECKSCHGHGKETCKTCGGKKDMVCSKCKGHGEFSNCNACNSTGRVDCERCHGSGKIREKCNNCRGSGTVTKTRYRNCGKCHGAGVFHERSRNYVKEEWVYFDRKCSACNGTGQIKESYKETCPTCGGDGKKSNTIVCPSCGGRGDFQCSKCHGTGHAVCGDCAGSGKVKCNSCRGSGEVTCHECHGGKNHVCIECYGTGIEPTSGIPKLVTGQNFDLAVEFQKKKDYVSAFLKFREAATQDHSAAALWRLGRMYERGQAVCQSTKKANALFAAAANAGSKNGLYYLGLNYSKGEGVEKNVSEARRLLELAVSKGCEKAQEEYEKVAEEALSTKPVSGVVGWRGKFSIPKFLPEADPAADQAAKIAKEKAEKRAALMVRIYRSLWWWLFRGAAAAVFAFGWTKYSEAWSDGEYAALLAGGFLLTSLCIRPKFAETGYMLLTIGAIAATFCLADGSVVYWSLAVLLSLTTLFMRNLGEKMSLPMLTYPLMGAAVGFLASPLCCYDTLEKGNSECSIIFEILAVVVYLYNIGDIHGKGGCAAKGKRTPQIATTFIVLTVLAAAVGFFVCDTSHIQRVLRSDTEKIESRQTVKAVKEEQKQQQVMDNLTDFERGMKYKNGDDVSQDISRAKKCLERAVKEKNHEAEFELGRILIDEGDVQEGWRLIKQSANFGHQEANFMLGEKAQKDGKGNEAFHAFVEAARNGHVKSMLKVADYYAEKTGVFGGCRDKDKAIEWYKKAAAQGSEAAKKALSEL